MQKLVITCAVTGSLSQRGEGKGQTSKVEGRVGLPLPLVGLQKCLTCWRSWSRLQRRGTP